MFSVSWTKTKLMCANEQRIMWRSLILKPKRILFSTIVSASVLILDSILDRHFPVNIIYILLTFAYKAVSSPQTQRKEVLLSFSSDLQIPKQREAFVAFSKTINPHLVFQLFKMFVPFAPRKNELMFPSELALFLVVRLQLGQIGTVSQFLTSAAAAAVFPSREMSGRQEKLCNANWFRQLSA